MEITILLQGYNMVVTSLQNKVVKWPCNWHSNNHVTTSWLGLLQPCYNHVNVTTM